MNFLQNSNSTDVLVLFIDKGLMEVAVYTEKKI